eukprot:s956_g11.t1
MRAMMASAGMWVKLWNRCIDTSQFVVLTDVEQLVPGLSCGCQDTHFGDQEDPVRCELCEHRHRVSAWTLIFEASGQFVVLTDGNWCQASFGH